MEYLLEFKRYVYVSLFTTKVNVIQQKMGSKSFVTLKKN